MPKLKYALPKYRRHKASGNAVVTIGGKDHYLGPYGSEASRSEYDRLIADWIASGRPTVEIDRSAPPSRKSPCPIYSTPSGTTVKNGRVTDEFAGIRAALQHVLALHGQIRAAEFGPLALRAVQDRLVKSAISGAPDAAGRPKRSTKPLIDQADTEAERDFLEFCISFQGEDTVGVWAGEPLDYRPLSEAADCPPNMEAISAERKEAWIRQGRMSEASFRKEKPPKTHLLGRLVHQPVGYVGFLTFHAPYRDELASLKSQWERLPTKLPINIQLGVLREALRQSSPARGAAPLPDEADQFYQALAEFLRKWQLLQLVTWDLPVAQSPRTLRAGDLVAECGPDAIVHYFPEYYDIPAEDQIRDRIRLSQSVHGKELGVDIELPITYLSGRYNRREDRWMCSDYESAFRMWLIESTTIRRYGTPRGLVTRLKEAFEILFEISPDRVRKLRRHYGDLVHDASVARSYQHPRRTRLLA